jgi:hypothetical protein
VENLQGWIKLHRKIRTSPIFNDLELYRLATICLTEAYHKEVDQPIGNQVVKILPGQFVTGRFDLHDMYNRGLKPKDRVSEKTVWRWLEKLQKLEFLTIKSTNKYSVVSIENWSLYQEDEQRNDQQMTNKCPTDDQQMTTNKNVKNVKNNTSRHKFDPCDMEAANWLFKLIQQNNENAKEPDFEKWANEFRLMRERDNRTVEQINYLINWSQNDSFWKANILSPAALRKQFDKLIVRVKEEKARPKAKVVPIQKQNAITYNELDLEGLAGE